MLPSCYGTFQVDKHEAASVGMYIAMLFMIRIHNVHHKQV